MMGKILVVDDEPRNLRLLQAFLVPLGHDVITAQSGDQALDIIGKNPPDLILLDIMMPGIDGFEVLRRLKGNPDTLEIPVVMVTALREVEERVTALEAGADDYLTKPVHYEELKARVRSLLKVKAYHDHLRNYREELERAVNERTRALTQALKEVRAASLDTIFRLCRAAEYKDDETGMHIHRMAHYCEALARAMDLDEGFTQSLLHAAPMHDIGKIGIPDHILLKPGPLNDTEWKIMKAHTTIGAKILAGASADLLQLGEIIALRHHEKWDGTGYPDGLQGEEIPLVGRITAVADVFDALISKRPYKEAFSIEESFRIIRQGRGAHFDPRAVDALFAVKEEILSIRERFRDPDMTTDHWSQKQGGEPQGSI